MVASILQVHIIPTHISAPLLEVTHIFAPLHWCRDARPHSGTVLYMEGPALIHLYWRHHSDNCNTTKMQPPTTYLIYVQ